METIAIFIAASLWKSSIGNHVGANLVRTKHVQRDRFLTQTIADASASLTNHVLQDSSLIILHVSVDASKTSTVRELSSLTVRRANVSAPRTTSLARRDSSSTGYTADVT